MSSPAPILISGAGIGGLAAALALAQRGFAAHVLEKRAGPAEEGAGIQIGPNGVHILRQLGVAGALAPLTASPDSLYIMDGVAGRELTRLPLGTTIETRHGAPYWTAHRADVHSTLLAAAQNEPLISVSFGSDVIAAQSHEDRVRLHLSDGSELDGAALIAAEGLWSTTRGSLFKSAPPVHSGSCAYRAVIPADRLPGGLSAGSTHIWLAPSAHVVHYPVRAGQEIAIVVILEGRAIVAGWGTDIAAAQIQDRFANAPSPLRELISRPASWRGWPLMKLPTPTAWNEGRIALLGDAAHPVLPFLAQGAVMALEDSVVLADRLAHSPQAIAGALAQYARERVPRTSRVARASRHNGRIYHLAGPFAAARNAVLRTGSPRRLLASFDWLYGWRAPAGGQNLR